MRNVTVRDSISYKKCLEEQKGRIDDNISGQKGWNVENANWCSSTLRGSL